MIIKELLQDIKDGGNAIYMIEKFYIEKEKQQIINSYNDGQSHSISNYKDGEDYYNKVFNNN